MIIKKMVFVMLLASLSIASSVSQSAVLADGGDPGPGPVAPPPVSATMLNSHEAILVADGPDPGPVAPPPVSATMLNSREAILVADGPDPGPGPVAPPPVSTNV